MRRGAPAAAPVKGKRASGPPTPGNRAKWLPPLGRREPPLGNTQVIRPDPEAQGESPPASAIRARLAYSLRPFQRSRVAACRTTRTAPAVQLIGRVSPDGTGRLVIQGTSTCGSVHSCPCCVAPILTKRSEELQRALDAHRRERTAIVTLTLRHHAGVPLRVLRTLLGRAWSEMWAGNRGRALRAELGLVGHIRSAEQTWGENGWHPHLHCLLFFETQPADGWEEALTDRWLTVVRQIYGRLWDTALTCERLEETEALRMQAQRVLGSWVSGGSEKRRRHDPTTLAERAAEFRRGLSKLGGLGGVMPDRAHAVKAELCESGKASRYLAKMGCELTGVLSKAGKSGHYTHWQIAQLAADGEAWAKKLWQEHSAAMLGARQLTWSRGLRDRLGLEPERPDEVLAAETLPEEGDVDTPLAELDGALWDLFAKQQRQLWVAHLHQAYADGTLDQTLWGPSRAARKPVEPAPVWWNAEARSTAARREGGQQFAAMTKAGEQLEEQRGRPYLTKAAREELREELRDYLREDLGIGST